MSASTTVHDGGLSRLRELATQLPFGVLVLDRDGDLTAATGAACALLGVADEAAVQAQWPVLREELGLPASSARVRAPARGSPGARGGALRTEVRAIADDAASGYLVLVKSRVVLDRAEESLVEASRCRAQQHVLGGLVHDLNGPLNNLTLTLALMEGVIARHPPDAPAEAAFARLRRYLATLQGESARLAANAQGMGAMLHAESCPPVHVPLGPVLDEVRARLRHHAALREVDLEVAPVDGETTAHLDPGALRLALIDLTLAAIACATGRARITLQASAAAATVTVGIEVSPAVLPPAAVAAFDALVVAPASEWLELVAGRLIVMQQGGRATLGTREQSVTIVAELSRGP